MDIKILKHSLEKRIEKDKTLYDFLTNDKPKMLTRKDVEFIKEHEEHLKCLNNFVDEMKRVGYRHGSNIFGDKYN